MSEFDLDQCVWPEGASCFTKNCFELYLYDYANQIKTRVNPTKPLHVVFLGSGDAYAEICFAQLLRSLGLTVIDHHVDYQNIVTNHFVER